MGRSANTKSPLYFEKYRGRELRGTTSFYPDLTARTSAGNYHCRSPVTGRTRQRLRSGHAAFSVKLAGCILLRAGYPFAAAGALWIPRLAQVTSSG